jgi:hypothetical protein
MTNPIAKASFVRRHLLTCAELSAGEINALLDLADKAAENNRQIIKKRDVLRGRTLINLFFEASTRTQSSFELAGKRLGADVMNMNVSTSSVQKGETLIDTAMTLNAMRPDILVVRHHAAGAVELLAQKVGFDPSKPLTGSDPSFLGKWFASLELSAHDVSKIDHFATDSPLAAAVAIEQAANGTSLMLVFEIGQAVLLFPGDAQWGTWDNAIKTARPLLERTNFLKVGHHGSHNASPKSFVNDVLGGDFKAMVSTRPTKIFKQIPRLPLLTALVAKQAAPALARSDQAAVPAAFHRISDICVEATMVI